MKQVYILLNSIYFYLLLFNFNKDSVETKKSETRAKGHTKINELELELINRKVFKNRHLTAANIKDSLNIRASVRTVQKYLNLLGWSKVRTKLAFYNIN